MGAGQRVRERRRPALTQPRRIGRAWRQAPGVAAAAAVVLVLATACGERREPTGPTVRLYPVTVQGTGDRPTVLRRAPQRIAAISPGLGTVLRALGAGGRTLLATPGRRPLQTLTGPALVGALTQLRPDLIVASEIADPDDLRRAVAATRAALYVFPDSSLHDIERGFTELGLLVDEPVAARGLVHRLEEARRVVAGRLRDVHRTTTVFLDTGYFITVPSASLIGDLIHEARGQSVAGRDPEAGPFDLATLVRLDPDIYLATADSETTLKGLRANPRIRRLRAIRLGRFETIPSSYLYPGPRLGEALDQLARLLHPDAFR